MCELTCLPEFKLPLSVGFDQNFSLICDVLYDHDPNVILHTWNKKVEVSGCSLIVMSFIYHQLQQISIASALHQ